MKINQQYTSTLYIVLRGSFNPVIIQPSWLEQKELIRDSDIPADDFQIIHNEVTRFSVDSMELDISKDVFRVITKNEHLYNPCKDLVVGIFNQLPETPLRALGVTTERTYDLQNEETYSKFGAWLSPLNNWTNVIDNPKVLRLDIINQKRPDELAGHIQIGIRPANLSNKKYAIIVSVNDHFATENGPDKSNNYLIQCLSENWEHVQSRVESITEQLFSNFAKSN